MKPWQKYALVALTALLAGFGYGRFSAPDKVTKVDQSEELIALRLQVATLTSENTNLKRHTVKTTRTEFSPTTARPVLRTVVEDTHVDLTKDLHTDVKTSTDVHSAKLTTSTLTQERERPNWELSLMGGVGLTNFTDPWNAGSWKFVAGAHLQRRIAGPFKGGVWGIGGSGLLAGGVSLGMEF